MVVLSIIMVIVLAPVVIPLALLCYIGSAQERKAQAKAEAAGAE